MDYLTRAEYEHEALRVMLAVKKELLTRLAKARGVNLLHLEDVLRFWRDFFCRKHLAAEEEFLFKLLYQVNHPALEGLAVEHERLQQNLDELEQISKKLRVGKPNSGREFFEAGEKFIASLENHLNKENSIFAELVLNKTETDWSAVPFYPEEELTKLTGIFSLLDNLSREYLGKEYKATWTQRWGTEKTDKNRETIDECEEKTLNSDEKQEQQGQEEQQNEKHPEQEEPGESFADKKQNTWPEQAGIGEQNEKI